MATSMVDIHTCMCTLNSLLPLPQSHYSPQLPYGGKKDSILAGPCIHSVHSGTCFPTVWHSLDHIIRTAAS